MGRVPCGVLLFCGCGSHRFSPSLPSCGSQVERILGSGSCTLSHRGFLHVTTEDWVQTRGL